MNDCAVDTLQVHNTAMEQVVFTDGNQTNEECSICYESFTNKAFVNDCLHHFCYNCIVTWTKVKAVCPLCIQPISGIIKNIRSLDDYDLEPVIPPIIDVLANFENDFDFTADSTNTESSYGGDESMDVSESEFGDSFIQEEILDDDDVSVNLQDDDYYHHEDDDQNDLESVFSENNESIFCGDAEDGNKDSEDEDQFYGSDNHGEGEESDHDDNNNDEYEADDDEDENNEENYSGYEYSEGANSDVGEDNENFNFCDNFSYDNESEYNENDASDSHEYSASDSHEDCTSESHEDNSVASDSHEDNSAASDSHEDNSAASDSHEEYNYEAYRDDDEDDYAEDASESDVKLDFDAESISGNDYCEYDEGLSDHDYYDYDDATEYLYPSSYY